MKTGSIARVLVPLAILVVVSLTAIYLLDRLSGGNEIGDDVVTLTRLVRHPFALWGNYRAEGFSDNWGSFPPLFPALFSVLVAPWLAVAGDFWGFRIGVLSWTIVVLFVLDSLLARAPGIPEPRRRRLLLLFVLLPSVLGTIALIPQEEIYVSLFVVALYAAAAARRWSLMPFLLLLSIFAGKYFLLILALPIALYSPSPRRNLIAWSSLGVAALVAYVSYHRLAHGLMPILNHGTSPRSGISIWTLVWNVGVQPPLRLFTTCSLACVAVFAAVFCARSRRGGRPLVFTCAGTLVGMFALLSLASPGYILWAVPLLSVAIGLMKKKAHRAWSIALLVLWGVGEWGANFFHGVAFALGTDRPAGKETLASFAQRLFGSDFPFSLANVVFLALVFACAIGLLYLLSAAPTVESGAKSGAECS
jgi:hypothetical protein